jgi:hypothetical protein
MKKGFVILVAVFCNVFLLIFPSKMFATESSFNSSPSPSSANRTIYYVVIGSWANINNALDYINDCPRELASGKIYKTTVNGQLLYRYVVGEYYSLSAARQRVREVENNYGYTAWVWTSRQVLKAYRKMSGGGNNRTITNNRGNTSSSKEWIYGRWVGYYKGCKVELIFTENSMTEKYDGQTAYSGSYLYESQGFIAYNASRPGVYNDMWPFDAKRKVMLLDNTPMQKYSY